MIFQPRIVYDVSTEVIFTVPMKPWEYEEGAGLGGEDTSAAGVPESYTVRWDQFIKLTLRFTEAERAAVMDWLLWAVQHKGTPFSLFIDQTDVTGIAVYLDSPTAKDRIQSPREQATPWIFTTQVTLRQVAGVRFNRAMRP